MVHSISHELKTPLNGIVNLVQSLTNLKEVTDNVKSKYLKPALDCSTLMVQVINDIIDFTQSNLDEIRISPQNTDLREIIDSVLDV